SAETISGGRQLSSEDVIGEVKKAGREKEKKGSIMIIGCYLAAKRQWWVIPVLFVLLYVSFAYHGDGNVSQGVMIYLKSIGEDPLRHILSFIIG
ncbi:hypothetical protein LCGC14_2355620, partial [marine sediment metagenome]